MIDVTSCRTLYFTNEPTDRTLMSDALYITSLDAQGFPQKAIPCSWAK
jgi:hypothetical protein